MNVKKLRQSSTTRSTSGRKALRPLDWPWPSRSRAKQANPCWARKMGVDWNVQLMSLQEPWTMRMTPRGGETENVEEIALKISKWPKASGTHKRITVITQGADPVVVADDGKIKLFPVILLPTEKLVDEKLGELERGVYMALCWERGVLVAIALSDMHKCKSRKNVKRFKGEIRTQNVKDLSFQDQPRSPFHYFMESFVETCKAKNQIEVDRKGFETWRTMSKQERLPYVLQAAKVNSSYEKALLQEVDDDEADSAAVAMSRSLCMRSCPTEWDGSLTKGAYNNPCVCVGVEESIREAKAEAEERERLQLSCPYSPAAEAAAEDRNWEVWQTCYVLSFLIVRRAAKARLPPAGEAKLLGC